MSEKDFLSKDIDYLQKDILIKFGELENSLKEKQQETLLLFLEEIKSAQTNNRIYLLKQVTEVFKNIIDEKKIGFSSFIQPSKPSESYSLKKLFTKDLKITFAVLFGLMMCFGISNALTYFFVKENRQLSNLRAELTAYGSILKTAWPHLTTKERERLMKLSRERKTKVRAG